MRLGLLLLRRGTEPGRQNFYVQHFVAALTQLPKSARKVSGEPLEYIPAIVLGPVGGIRCSCKHKKGGSKAKHSRAGPRQEPPLGFSGRLLREAATDNVCGETAFVDFPLPAQSTSEGHSGLCKPHRGEGSRIYTPLASPGTLLSLEQMLYVYVYTAPTTALRENLHKWGEKWVHQ